jgi:hypothetical protein
VLHLLAQGRVSTAATTTVTLVETAGVEDVLEPLPVAVRVGSPLKELLQISPLNKGLQISIS